MRHLISPKRLDADERAGSVDPKEQRLQQMASCGGEPGSGNDTKGDAESHGVREC
jgi:hypothetical protein